MALWEYDSHKVVVLLVTCVVRVLFSLFFAYKSGSSRSVVSVCNVECRDAGKDLGYLVYGLFVVYYPEMMPKAILCHKVVLGRFALYNILYYSINFGVVGISKENRLKVGILDSNMNHSVFLLILTGKFMFFDLACKIILYVCTNNKTVLGTSIHCLGIYIVVFCRILN